MSSLILIWNHLALARPREERGASAVEYGLLVAGIAAVIVGGVFLFGDFLSTLMGDSCGTINAEVNERDC